jgi:hypothetical protein
MHCYRLFGLVLHSEITLPELRETTGEPDVTITCGKVQGRPETEWVMGLAATPGGGVVEVRDIARFGIGGGNAIIVDPDPQAPERNVRAFLLGSAIGALLHQRRMLPLHANAVALDGRAVAFAGRSGAGKSTLAAAFHDRGCRLLSDDICVVTRDDAGKVEAQPGIPRVRLWRDAVERSGRDTDALDSAFDGTEKYVLPVAEGHAEQPLPLAAIYILAEAEDFAIHALNTVSAAKALALNTYRGAYVPVIGDTAAHFEYCLRVSREVPVFMLDRPWDEARVAETVDRIEAHLAEIDR